MSLKEKAVNGVIWNSIGKISSYGVEFLVGVILARILSPREFGLVGTILIVIALSEIFINSGFTQAIVRKKDCTQKDYSTVFFFNFGAGSFLFILLIFIAHPISLFFKNPELTPLIQALGFGLIISSLTVIQKARLIKEINFKLQTKISMLATVLSGIIAIYMAYVGYGVWSLIAKSLFNQAFTSIFLWYSNRWKPSLVFSKESFKELFGFGSKLLISGLVGTLFQNINYIIIGKFFSPQNLGYFTEAEMYKNLPSQNVSGIVTSVVYPVLVKLQDDPVKMKRAFRKMFTTTFFIISILMFGMAGAAQPIIITIVGVKWAPSIVLLQMLCFIGLMFPLNSMNVNILNVVGRSDIYLKLQMIIQLFTIPNIFIAIFFGVKALIVGMMAVNLIGYLIFNQASKKIIHYSIKEQLIDIFPSFLLAMGMGTTIYLITYFSKLSMPITLIIELFAAAIVVVLFSELFKIKEYLFIKQTIKDKINLSFIR